MNLCRIEFESYSLSGEDYEFRDTNVGQVVIISADIKARHYEPISFFPSNIEKSFSIRILEPLIKRFSGMRKDNLKYIALSKHKILGCGVRKDLPYNSYSFGFSPFSFFFDPFLDGDPFSDPKNKEILGILRSARQEILDTYQLIAGRRKNTITRQVETSDFLWENSPIINEVWNCWTCYFIIK